MCRNRELSSLNFKHYEIQILQDAGSKELVVVRMRVFSPRKSCTPSKFPKGTFVVKILVRCLKIVFIIVFEKGAFLQGINDLIILSSQSQQFTSKQVLKTLLIDFLTAKTN